MPGINRVPFVRARKVQNDTRPQFILQVERSGMFTRVLPKLAHLRIGVRLQRDGPHLAQFLTASLESRDHALDIHLYRVQANVEAESEQRGLFTAGEGLPDR